MFISMITSWTSSNISIAKVNKPNYTTEINK